MEFSKTLCESMAGADERILTEACGAVSISSQVLSQGQMVAGQIRVAPICVVLERVEPREH